MHTLPPSADVQRNDMVSPGFALASRAAGLGEPLPQLRSALSAPLTGSWLDTSRIALSSAG